MYIFETSQMIEQLEHLILSGEEERDFSESAINEIFRIMHTVKGSSAMMMFHEVATLAHTMEDIFYFLREKKPKKIDCSALSDFSTRLFNQGKSYRILRAWCWNGRGGKKYRGHWRNTIRR